MESSDWKIYSSGSKIDTIQELGPTPVPFSQKLIKWYPHISNAPQDAKMNKNKPLTTGPKRRKKNTIKDV